MIKSRLSRYLIGVYSSVLWQDARPGQQSAQAVTAVRPGPQPRSWSRSVLSEYLEHDDPHNSDCLQSDVCYCLSPPIPGILLLFVRWLMLWLESGCAEVNVSKWRCLNNKGLVRNGFILTIRLRQGELYQEEGTESEVLIRSGCCTLQSRALQALLLLIRSWFCKY